MLVLYKKIERATPLCLVGEITKNKLVRATTLCLVGQKPRRVRPRIATPQLKFSNSSNSLSMRELQAEAKYRAMGHVKKKSTLHPSVSHF
jgi:hypothetical protein